MPAGQMGELRSYFYVCQTAADVDRDQRRDVRDCEAVAGNELMSAQFAIHPFETPINYRSLLFAVFRKLLEAALKDRTGILNRAYNRSQEFQFHPTILPLDLGLCVQVAPEKIRFRMKPLQVPANCY